jgi:hypothetical protein
MVLSTLWKWEEEVTQELTWAEQEQQDEGKVGNPTREPTRGPTRGQQETQGEPRLGLPVELAEV